MILQVRAEDWAIASGKLHLFMILLEWPSHVGIEIEFSGKGLQEKAIISKCNNVNYQLEVEKEVLSIDSKYFRPTEVDMLIGDPTRQKQN